MNSKTFSAIQPRGFAGAEHDECDGVQRISCLPKWIVERLESLGVTLGKLSVQLKTLNSKVDTVGHDISMTLSENVPRPAEEGIPESLVDLIATVSLNRMEGIRAAFEIVQRALKENYPQLRRVLPAQLPEAMDRLVDKGEMEPDVALSVR
jgi:hypothetical protein